jgi:hypothetical protein
MKATDLKCPKCGAVPTSNSWEWTLDESAMAYRKLAIAVDAEGSVTQIEGLDLSYDITDDESLISHHGCGQFPVPKGFWDFDVYG